MLRKGIVLCVATVGFVALSLLLYGCAATPTPPPPPTPMIVIVTQPPLPTYTPYPTQTPLPTYTPAPTYTPYPTSTPLPPTPAPTPTPTAMPTLPPTPTIRPTDTPAPAPVAPPPPADVVRVEYKDLHYECQGFRDWGGGVKGYRSFQVAMIVTNRGSDAILPPWKPTRWLITGDGSSFRVEVRIWQWGQRGQTFAQPTIAPGATEGWTWMAYPLNQGEWVGAVEWEHGGKTYRNDLPKPNMSLREYNYVNCD